MQFLFERLYLCSFATMFWKTSGFMCICREIVYVAIYVLYLESFCSENLGIRKVFAFSDSALRIPQPMLATHVQPNLHHWIGFSSANYFVDLCIFFFFKIYVCPICNTGILTHLVPW